MIRRYLRPVLVIAIILIATHLLYSSLAPRPNVPRRPITKSSYDWSRWHAFHPVTSVQALPTAKPRRLSRIQQKRFENSDLKLAQHRRDLIKQTMTKCWQNYVKHAWMMDEVRPLTGKGINTFGGWAATLVDSLDTLWIMGMKDEFYKAVEAVTIIDWADFHGGSACNMFETTIRYLGGLLAAYDLSREMALLDKAVELGDMLMAGFDTPNHMPGFWLDFGKARLGNLLADEHQPAASITLQMEFTRLAQLTGKNKYYDAVARVTDRLHEVQNRTKIPGLWPTFFQLRHDMFTLDNSFTLGALSDSMYEYVLKTHLLLGGTEPKYEEMWRTAANPLIEYLLFRPMTPDNLDILLSGTYTFEEANEKGRKSRLNPQAQHLACFAGGMFALGGKLYNLPEHVEVGEKLTKGCIWAYGSSMNGVAPEIFELLSCETNAHCAWDQQRWTEAVGGRDVPRGFASVSDPRYILRPEAVESVFVLYRITGKQEYRDAAWRMYMAIQGITDAPYGNAAIADVTLPEPRQLNSMESFWMAETLKYLYLTFSPPDLISLDDYVFNTEAHPFIIPKG